MKRADRGRQKGPCSKFEGCSFEHEAAKEGKRQKTKERSAIAVENIAVQQLRTNTRRVQKPETSENFREPVRQSKMLGGSILKRGQKLPSEKLLARCSRQVVERAKSREKTPIPQRQPDWRHKHKESERTTGMIKDLQCGTRGERSMQDTKAHKLHKELVQIKRTLLRCSQKSVLQKLCP